MIAGQLIEMLQVQDRMNAIVNPQWYTAEYSWPRAILVETIELLDHVGWKWWKKQDMDLQKARMEFIDIWHFVLSQALVEAKGVVQAATLDIMRQWEFAPSDVLFEDNDGKRHDLLSLDLQRRIELFGSMAGVNGSVVLPLLRSIADDLELDDAKIFELYMCKNALNQFRQAHGYKEGTYTKVWDGKEDNEVLQEIVDSTPQLTFNGLMQALETRYAALDK